MVPPVLGSNLSGTYPKSRLIGSEESSPCTEAHSPKMVECCYSHVCIFHAVLMRQHNSRQHIFRLNTSNIYIFSLTPSVWGRAWGVDFLTYCIQRRGRHDDWGLHTLPLRLVSRIKPHPLCPLAICFPLKSHCPYLNSCPPNNCCPLGCHCVPVASHCHAYL